MPEFVKQIAQDVSGRIEKIRKKAAKISSRHSFIPQ